MNKVLALGLGFAVAVAYAGLSRADDSPCCSSAKCVAKCPISGGEISKEASVAYKGGKLYFCCAGCIPKYKEDPAKYQAQANQQLVLTGQAKQVHCPLSGGKLDPKTKITIDGVDVCFCCAGCQAKVKSASAEKQCEIVFVKGFDKAFAVKTDKKKP